MAERNQCDASEEKSEAVLSGNAGKREKAIVRGMVRDWGGHELIPGGKECKPYLRADELKKLEENLRE